MGRNSERGSGDGGNGNQNRESESTAMTETATIANVLGSEVSLESLWMPFTANRAFKRAPRLLASASGMYYTSVDGRRILDGTAGLWCVP